MSIGNDREAEINKEIKKLQAEKAELKKEKAREKRNRQCYEQFMKLTGFTQYSNEGLLSEFRYFFYSRNGGLSTSYDYGREYEIDQVIEFMNEQISEIQRDIDEYRQWINMLEDGKIDVKKDWKYKPLKED